MLGMDSYCNLHWRETTDSKRQRMLEGSTQEEGPSTRRLKYNPVCHELFVKGPECRRTCWDE